MPIAKLKDFLDQNAVKYSLLTHSVAYTAQEIASIAHVPGNELAKSVMIRADGQLLMAVLPASFHVDLNALEQALGAREIHLATETEFKFQFPDCEPGAMPPFGNLYGIPVCVDETLTWDNEIVFNAGTHRELIRMPYADFAKLVKPDVLAFAMRKLAAAS